LCRAFLKPEERLTRYRDTTENRVPASNLADTPETLGPQDHQLL
jgi:hypothetical protein